MNLAAMLIAGALVAVLGAIRLLEGQRGREAASGRAQGARWASKRDLRDLRVQGQKGKGRLVLGRQGSGLLATVDRASVVVVGPSRIARKTSGFTIPAVLEWQGPVVATSVKSDLLKNTIAERTRMGEAMVFDPTGVTGMGNVKATPLSACGEWRGAMRMAHMLSESARTSSDGLEDSAFWHAAAEKLIAPMLFAAANSGTEMGGVIDWLHRGAGAASEINGHLLETGSSEAMSAWEANWGREDRTLSSVFTTAETILAAFVDPLVKEATSRADYTPEALLDGGANTLYLYAPTREQKRLRILFAAMLCELVGLVEERAGETGEPIEPALLMVLDEAANIAPLPDLDTLAATGAGQGIQLVSAFQDFAQVERRWGKAAATILNNHHAKVFTNGISDPATLRYISDVVGEGEFREHRETTGTQGHGSSTEGTIYRALTPANVVREARPGSGLLIYGHRPAARIELRPWFEDEELTAMVRGGAR